MNDPIHHPLKQLHEELLRQPSLDPETIAELRSLADDIQKLLARENPTPAPEGSDENLSSRLQNLIEQFEAQHPQLTKTLSMIAERLSDMGI